MLPIIVYFYCVLCAAATAIQGANILVFMPLPIKSHFRGFQPLFEELSRRGHNVTVASSYPLDPPIANYTDIGPFVSEDRGRNVMDLVQMNCIESAKLLWFIATEFAESVLPHEKMKRFIRSDSDSFDLVMVEAFCQEYTVAIGHKFNAPVVSLAPAMIWGSISKWVHVPSTFSYIPYTCLKTANDLNFMERLTNTVTGVVQMYLGDYLYMPKMKTIMDKYFTYDGWESRPSLERMLNNVSVTLINCHHAIGVPRPYLPGVVEVGGMHIKEPKNLPQNLQHFIDSAEHGVIYFSFGSVVNMNDLPKEKTDIFLRVIGRLKQKVILKWIPADGRIKLSENVLTGSWFPQNDILAHPNVRLFITHGGLHSLEESVYNAKPTIGIPFFADQFFNMKTVEKNGYGKMVEFFEMTEESFGKAIEEVLSDPTFKHRAEIQSRIYSDQPMKPLDRAVYWVEYVIQNAGAGHLKSDSIGLNEAQYFLLDVQLIVLGSALLIACLCYSAIAKCLPKKKKIT